MAAIIVDTMAWEDSPIMAPAFMEAYMEHILMVHMEDMEDVVGDMAMVLMVDIRNR